MKFSNNRLTNMRVVTKCITKWCNYLMLSKYNKCMSLLSHMNNVLHQIYMRGKAHAFFFLNSLWKYWIIVRQNVSLYFVIFYFYELYFVIFRRWQLNHFNIVTLLKYYLFIYIIWHGSKECIFLRSQLPVSKVCDETIYSK